MRKGDKRKRPPRLKSAAETWKVLSWSGDQKTIELYEMLPLGFRSKLLSHWIVTAPISFWIKYVNKPAKHRFEAMKNPPSPRASSISPQAYERIRKISPGFRSEFICKLIQKNAKKASHNFLV